ncbi:MAG: flagellar basal body P-ring protein FlgI [Deltaproteobacteria bacterium]|nr:flagellar basal body P-ring protein FlgI [Deltaproteobacteria bacterium]
MRNHVNLAVLVRRAVAILAAIGALAATAHADRIKDLASIAGVRSNQLTGYGIVVGLDGTGDDARSPMVRRSLAKMLKKLGVTVDANEIKAKNVAAVIVTAELPPFARPGSGLDITVSSVGSAKSLAGGTLLQTPLRGADNRTWALAQGALTVGGYAVSGGTGSEARKNHVTVGRIPGGAQVEADAPTEMPTREVVLVLATPDFTTATRVSAAIVAALGEGAASVRDAGSIVVPVSKARKGHVAELIAALEAIEVEPDAPAKIIVDERTGTVVIGEHVRLAPVAVAYGGLTIDIRETPEASQPGGIASGGTTTVVPKTEIKVTEGQGSLHPLAGGATVGDVVKSLNALGASPRDLIAILQALKAAGALRAELEVL